jgi:hypothetical protein
MVAGESSYCRIYKIRTLEHAGMQDRETKRHPRYFADLDISVRRGIDGVLTMGNVNHSMPLWMM